MKKVAKLFVICVPIVVLALAVNSPAAAKTPFEGQGNQQRDIVWLYESPLTVYEEITDLGGGVFEYKFRFQNVDDKHLWHFGVYTTFDIISSANTWDQYHETWLTAFLNDLPSINPEVYDARNLNPDLSAICATYGGLYPDIANPIDPGESVHGFTFEAHTYDNGPKLYYYETMEDGWAAETGYIAAIGYTQSPSVATELGTWGGIKSLYR